MKLFHEIYGAYFRIVGQLLGHRKLTKKHVRSTVWQEGFSESVVYLEPKILPQNDNSDYGLLHQNDDGTFSPVTKHKPLHPITLLQKRWLRTKLDDPRMGLFLSDEERDALRAQLSGTEPLYTSDTLLYPDQFADGDDFEGRRYQQHFREILTAVRNREYLDVSYRGGKGRNLRLKVIPFRIEYSEKNDRFRVYCILPHSRKADQVMILNLANILSLNRLSERYSGKIDAEQCFAKRRCQEPVTVRVKPERNAVERFMMEFASYEKRTERDTDSETITVKLWYDQQDETELLIRLLSFGPVLEILAPADFRAKAAERIRKQCELLR